MCFDCLATLAQVDDWRHWMLASWLRPLADAAVRERTHTMFEADGVAGPREPVPAFAPRRRRGAVNGGAGGRADGYPTGRRSEKNIETKARHAAGPF